MRIWDLEPTILCRQHLLGEHRELHSLWTVISQNKKGYSQHPETKRWVGKLSALYARHESLVVEMEGRGYKHNSPLDKSLATGSEVQDVFLHTKDEQIAIIKAKQCFCLINNLTLDAKR